MNYKAYPICKLANNPLHGIRDLPYGQIYDVNYYQKQDHTEQMTVFDNLKKSQDVKCKIVIHTIKLEVRKYTQPILEECGSNISHENKGVLC